MEKIESFSYNGQVLKTEHISSSEVFPGVICDVYTHPETNERDLAIISIEAGKKTKPQLVVSGTVTIEGYMSGRGRLLVIKASGEKSIFEVGPEKEGFACTLEVGEVMQWQADKDLVVYEICYPPYQDGRYKNLDDEML